MNAGSRILILVHEHDGYPGRQVHQIWPAVDIWREQGIEVRVAVGIDDPVASEEVDLILPHVNLSVTPPEYREWLDARTNVLNRGIHDISKRAISRSIVTAGEDYEGPVVVKTDLNYGGLPESAMAYRARNASLFGRIRRKLFGKPEYQRPAHTGLEDAQVLESVDYEVFDAKRDVPPGVFANDALVVERFLPERRGDLYMLRAYLFLGDAYISEIRGGPNPIVKGPGQTLRERCDPHPGIVALREELGWDYGKFDFAVRDDEVVLYDANRTPGRPSTRDYDLERARILAPGIHALLQTGPSGATSPWAPTTRP